MHDVADGGVGVALAEMAVRSGVGVTSAGSPATATCSARRRRGSSSAWPPVEVDNVRRLAGEAGIAVGQLGVAGGDRLVIDGLLDVGVADAIEASRTALPRLLGIEGASAGAAAS